MIGLNLGFNYKNFDFTANFYGTFGNDIFNITKGRYSGVSVDRTYGQVHWKKHGMARVPAMTFHACRTMTLNQNYRRVSSFFVEDGSYLRCKLLQIGYTLPKKLLEEQSCVFHSQHRIRLPLPVIQEWILNARMIGNTKLWKCNQYRYRWHCLS